MSGSIKAIPQNYIFEANDSLYKVVSAETLEGEEISLVGYFPNLVLNLAYEFDGELTLHPKFGSQFKVSTYRRLDTNNKEGIVSYLSSDLFKGIGEKSAEKIYDVLGPEALKKILEDKSCLKSIRGFSDERINDLYDALLRNQNIEKIFVELYSYGLTPKMVNKLYEKYDDKTLEIVKSNPYRLVYDVDGFGFLKSDSLAIAFGFSYHDKIRIEEGILYTLINVCNSTGYCFLTETQLINSALNTLNRGITDSNLITLDEVNEALLILKNKDRIIEEEDRYYPYTIYQYEKKLAESIIKMNRVPDTIYDVKFLEEQISYVETQFNLTYTASQKLAIINAINNKISIITGGPGTGKTTILRGLLFLLASLEGKSIVDDAFRYKCLLCAPTGRAAKRLGSSCNMKAQTIHKALGYNYAKEFEYNADNKKREEIIIIDEFSMVDIGLASQLFEALKTDSKVIIVGDYNQLPSVACGNVLHDLIDSEAIVTTRLIDIMRQQEGSDIIELGGQIVDQDVRFEVFTRKTNKEVFFYPADASKALEKILIFVENFLNKGGNILTDLQVLIPMYSGPCGINEVNKAIQDRFNKEEVLVSRKDKVFKKFDKVLQLENNPNLQIMNGDIGYILDVEKDSDGDYLKIDFDGLIVKYPFAELEALTLAYAISIHKSQGSEYANVIMPIVKSYYVMLKKNLIYTAVTRAKNKLIVIGDFTSFADAAKRLEGKRQTTLVNRILNRKEIKRNVIYINDPEIPFDTLGEEGMEEITPYTFMN